MRAGVDRCRRSGIGSLVTVRVWVVGVPLVEEIANLRNSCLVAVLASKAPSSSQ
jgi:hypothetical protein